MKRTSVVRLGLEMNRLWYC